MAPPGVDGVPVNLGFQAEDKSQAQVARLLGVDQSVVSHWLEPNMQKHKGFHLDIRLC